MSLVKKAESAGGVVVGKDGRILVVNQNGNSWSLPKGGIEAGEEALDAARREIAEETGVTDLMYVKPLGSYKRFKIAKGGVGEDRSVFVTIHMFLFRTSQTELSPRDGENPEARWVEREKVSLLLTHPKDKEFFESVRFEL